MITENLRALQPGVVLRGAQVLTVADLGDDPRYVVVSDGSSEMPMPCSSGYPVRAVGDVVLAVQLAGGGWQVLASMAAAPSASGVTQDAVQALVDAVPVSRLSWGTAAPSGASWQQGTAWGRDDGNGDWSLYLQIAGVVTPPSTKPAKTPGPVTISPHAQGSWRSGGQTDGDVKAGSWTGADWFGGWFYGTEIADACAGKTVASMKIKLARVSSNSGWNRGIPTHLGLHTRTSKGKPTLTSRWPGPKLSRGGRATATIPSGQVAQLASGSKAGVGVTGSGQSDYLIYADSGDITITFSA